MGKKKIQGAAHRSFTPSITACEEKGREQEHDVIRASLSSATLDLKQEMAGFCSLAKVAQSTNGPFRISSSRRVCALSFQDMASSSSASLLANLDI